VAADVNTVANKNAINSLLNLFRLLDSQNTPAQEQKATVTFFYLDLLFGGQPCS